MCINNAVVLHQYNDNSLELQVHTELRYSTRASSIPFFRRLHYATHAGVTALCFWTEATGASPTLSAPVKLDINADFTT